MIDFAKLSAPFPPDRVSWRVGPTKQDKTAGIALAYIDARDVMDRLDDVCGPGNWQDRYPHADAKTVCEIGIKVGNEWVWKSDGAGDTDTEAEKGALSSAFKRAAVKWGVGRYLYDVDSPWVEIEQRGKSYVIKQAEHGRLRKLLGAHAPPPGPRQIVNATSPQAPPAVAAEAEAGIREHLFQMVEEVHPFDLTIWAKRADIAQMIDTLDPADKDRLRARIKARRYEAKAKIEGVAA